MSWLQISGKTAFNKKRWQCNYSYSNIHEKVKKKLLKARLKLNMNVVKNALNEWYLGVGIELYECRYSILFNLDYFIYINEIQH